MISIKDRKILGQIFSHYDYVMTTAQLSKEKLYYRDVQRMLEAGLIERIKRGYYHWAAGSGKGDVVIISRLFPDGILCMETALFYYGYSDRNPAEWNIAIDKNASRQRTRIDYPSIKAYRLEPALLSIGVTRGEINFTDVRIYDRDRTICDVLRNMNKMDKEIFNKAIQGYVNDPQKNVPNLIEYAKTMRVWNKVKNLIGVWLYRSKSSYSFIVYDSDGNTSVRTISAGNAKRKYLMTDSSGTHQVYCVESGTVKF